MKHACETKEEQRPPIVSIGYSTLMNFNALKIIESYFILDYQHFNEAFEYSYDATHN